MQFRIKNSIGFFTGIGLFILVLLISGGSPMENNTRFTAATATLMAVWWLSESVSISVTALIPLILFPLFKILPAKEVALSYADSSVFLFMGGFFIAIAMQQHNLHKRIALNIINIMGTSPRKVVLSFMIATAFLSMWISNTATAMMMLPIGMAVVEHLNSYADSDNNTKERNNLGISIMLGIAYSASIGGIATLIGTPPNIIFTGMIHKIMPDLPEIDFLHWMIFGLPLAIVFLPLTWIYIVFFGSPVKSKFSDQSSHIVENELRELGKMSKGERITMIIFLLTSLGWIFRRDIEIGQFQITGWASLLNIQEYVNDATVALAGAFLLFVIPVNLRKKEFILNWDKAKQIPWGILILFGGGFALASGFQVSGLDKWIGNSFSTINYLSPVILVVSVCLLLTFLTEITSNTATITMILPVLAAMSVSLGVNPYVLMIPATLSTSFAFMMPVATPPNAIVFGSGYLHIKDMARVGLVLNLIGVFVITMAMFFIAFRLFDIVFT